MKNTILFKSLIDILYFLQIPGLLVVILIIPFGTFNINKVNFNIEEFTLIHWVIMITSLICYICFLRGLFYLRKVARFLLSKKYFADSIIVNLKKSGSHFLYTGIIYFLIKLTNWLNNINIGKLDFSFNDSSFIPLFITIIGLFFIIQSRTLILAKEMKEENDLTV